ncbi:MAG: erythromycin esterase family protein [Bacteroidia bacterium]|nr:erythromycin esterase family protein [Bacteroidia bacterium]
MNRIFCVITYAFCLLGILVPDSLHAQISDTTYWRENVYPLEIEGDSLSDSFFVLDSTVGKYRFFFTAEQHWRTINSQIQFAFLTYLHQKAGVRNLILEGGFTYGYLINRYLETGDKRLLKRVLNDIPVCPQDQMRMFEQLRKYNAQFPLEDRIMVSGIDLEHSPELALQGLSTIIPEQKPPDEIAVQVEEIKNLHQLRVFEAKKVNQLFQRLSKDFDQKNSIYSAYLGEDYDLAKLIVKNALQGKSFSLIKAVLFKKTWEKREEQLFANFVALQPRMKPGNYYAQFGALHTDIKASINWKFPSLAHRLNFYPESPVLGEVMTISRYFRRMSAEYNRLGEEDKLTQMVDYVEKNYKNPVVLCSMIGKNSPFAEMSKTFQYILLLEPEAEASPCE